MKTTRRSLNIIKHLKAGKTQWEVHKMGYPFGTVRYHYIKLFKPDQHAKFMERHKEKQRAKRAELSTQKK